MPRTLSLWLVPAALLALAGCGARADLKPRAGHTLPMAPYGRPDRPTAQELMAPGAQTRPSVNIELHTRSEERADDAFDLPPRDKD